MMNKPIEIEGYCRIVGDKFSPELAEKKTGIRFDRKNEVGEIGTIGRYKGSPIPFGYAEIDFVEKGSSADLISPDAPILDMLEEYQSCFLAAGATEIDLNIDVFYKDQCNLEQSHKLLKRLAILGVDLSISCQKL